ncbi:MAG: GNAT family N-acetyltransferase [Phycisphaerae bacterium]|nr:GNAT family N-acetyltransferase [Phycisphaerae bacterium]MDD5380270.1 GNAT family N-acetyltransferase [Phycisphaerae bacterium]
MEINLLSNSGKSRYDELAEKHGTVFSRLDWLKIFADKVRIYGIYDKNGGIIGGFHIYTERRLGFKLSRNPLFTPMIGPFLEVKAKNPVAIMDYWKETLSLLADFLDKLPCSIVSVSLSKEIVDTQPFVWKKFKVVPGYTYVLDLESSVDDIRSDMSAERRNDINKASRDGLVVRQVNDFKIVKSLVFKTLSRQDLAVDEVYLDRVLFEFANKNNCFAFAAFRENIPIAVSFCIRDSRTAYYLLGGYDDKNKHHGAGALAVWEAIKHAQSLGLKQFDFEGSMVPQIERYFRGFGGKLTPYYRVNKAKLPLEILLKLFKRELF